MKILNIKPPRGFNTLMRTVAKDYRNYRRARLQTWEAPLWTQLDMLDMYKNDFTHSRFILQEDGVEHGFVSFCPTQLKVMTISGTYRLQHFLGRLNRH